MIARSILTVLYVLLIFSVGFLVGQTWDSIFYGGVTGKVIDMPSDFVPNDKINVYEDRVVIEVKNAKLSTYESTGSMLPTLGEGTNGISIVPNSADELEVGDIVSFRKGDKFIVHRIVEKGIDIEGVYFVTQGDNSPADDGKIRFENIERVLIGLIY